jgi:toxin-antitoxin system PIN domain toxin
MAEPIALLDVNVLIALVDPQHVQHESSHLWFQAHGGHGWATCPLTQNALLRILGNPRYPNSPGVPLVVMSLLQALLAHTAHVFWPDDLSWEAAGVFEAEALLHHGQITDTYLLALAVHHQGRLVSFDRRLSPRAVRGGEDALHLIDPG